MRVTKSANSTAMIVGRTLTNKPPQARKETRHISARLADITESFLHGTQSRSKTRTHVIPASYGFAFQIKKGAHFRIIDLHGAQVIDMMAWRAPYSPSTACEHFSTSYTQYNLLGAAPPSVGEHLYTNHDNEMFKVVADMVKVHDMRFMACNPGFYRRMGQDGHRNCATNIAEAMTDFLSKANQDPDSGIGSMESNSGSDDQKGSGKVEWFQVHDPFNVFQNTPYYSIKGGLNSSRPGDYIEFKAEMDAIVALSCCPYDGDNFNGGKVTDVAVAWEVDE